MLLSLTRLTGWRADLAAAVLGMAAAGALPPLTLVPILLIAIPGLLLLVEGTATVWGAARRGFVFGVAHHLVGLYWVTNAILVQAVEFWWAVPIAVPMLAAVMAVFIAIPCACARAVPSGWRRVAVLAGAWVLGDIGRQFVLTGFPWNPLGSAWEIPGMVGLVMMQPAAWVGVHGLTGATVLLAGLAGLGWRARRAGLALLGLWAAVGAVLLHRPAGTDPGIMAVIVQGNVSEIEHRDHFRDRDWVDRIFERHLDLTRRGMAQAGPDARRRALVIWPETASPFALERDEGARRAIADAAGPALASLVGAPRAEAPGVFHNSLLAIGPDARVLNFYDKHHLVPYGEYFPSYLPIRLGEQGWTPGAGLKTWHLAGLPAIGPLICYEAIFPAQVVAPHDRPGLLVNVTNDSWFGDSAGPRQHLAAARIRAVEEGLPMVRAANTGISAVIDAHGRVIASLGLNKQGVLLAAVPGCLGPTPFSRLGLAAPALLAVASCAMGFRAGSRRPATL